MLVKRKAKGKPARFQIVISREKLDELEQLSSLAGFDSKKELLDNALSLWKWAVRQIQQGYSIASVNEAEADLTKQIRLIMEMPCFSYVRDNVEEQYPRVVHSATAISSNESTNGVSSKSHIVPQNTSASEKSSKAHPIPQSEFITEKSSKGHPMPQEAVISQCVRR